MNVGVLNCGHKLGDHFYQQKEYKDAELVLNEVWMVRKDALGQLGQEADDARSTGYVLASALYYQKTNETYGKAKAILSKLWATSKDFMSKEASPSNSSIGWRLAWTYRMLEKYASAEPVFLAIWESRKIDPGPSRARTLTAQYELGLTIGLLKHWAQAEGTFQNMWDKRKDVAESQSVRHNEAGHQLGVCLFEQDNHKAAIKVLNEVYTRRVNTLEVDAKDTKTTGKKQEEVRKAFAAQKAEQKAKTEAEAGEQKEKEEQKASDEAVREEALREEGRREIRDEYKGRRWFK